MSEERIEIKNAWMAEVQKAYGDPSNRIKALAAASQSKEPTEGELTPEEAAIPIEERFKMAAEVRTEVESPDGEVLLEFVKAEIFRTPTAEEIWYGNSSAIFPSSFEFVGKSGDRWFMWKSFMSLTGAMTEQSMEALLQRALGTDDVQLEIRHVGSIGRVVIDKPVVFYDATGTTILTLMKVSKPAEVSEVLKLAWGQKWFDLQKGVPQ